MMIFEFCCAERSCMRCGSHKSSRPYTCSLPSMWWLWPFPPHQLFTGHLGTCFSTTPMLLLSSQHLPSETWLSFSCSSIRHAHLYIYNDIRIWKYLPLLYLLFRFVAGFQKKSWRRTIFLSGGSVKRIKNVILLYISDPEIRDLSFLSSRGNTLPYGPAVQ